jgi:preprotein translocase subunit SecF
MPEHHNALIRLFRGETSFDFAGRWKRWFIISGLVIVIGWASVGVRGLNFSIDFKGGTSWEVPTSASVTDVRNALGNIGGSGSALRQATIEELTNRETGKRTIEVQAPAKETANSTEVAEVTSTLAKLAHVSTNDVTLNDIGPSWGSDITDKAVEAVIIFLVIVSIFIWVFFEGKMAIAALTALLHDILVTVGVYSLSGFQVSPDTVIAFLTILGYSLYDTIVVFDRVRENTKGLASTGRLTYTDTVNLSMNQVLARSINTSFVAILPILSILIIGAGLLGASALEDFGLALTIGLTTGAYSSIFIASPLLALLKERETRYSQIRSRLASRGGGGARLTPAALAVAGGRADGAFGSTTGASAPSRPRKRAADRVSSSGGGAAGRAAAGGSAGGGSGGRSIPGPAIPGPAIPGPATPGPGGRPADQGGGAGGDVQGSDVQGSDVPGSDLESPEARGPEARGPDDQRLAAPGSADEGATGSEAGAPTDVPARRSPTRPPPRPRKKGRRR